MKNLKPLFTLVILSCLFFENCSAISVQEDLTITSDQKLILDKFKGLMISRLPHIASYMFEDIYLIRWLRISNFDIREAEVKFMENLEWRKENKMDTIMTEDWSDYEAEFPYFLEGCDLDGRPIASANIGDWDIRRAMIAGKGGKMIRYFNKLYEEITYLIRSAQNEGKNITQFTILCNMNNFNMIQNGCPLCIPYYISILTSYEAHYPGSIHKAILVNTPPVFQTVLNAILPFINKRTRDLLVIYGKNRSTWQSKLFKDVSRDQLTFQFGGVKEDGFGIEFLRQSWRLPC